MKRTVLIFFVLVISVTILKSQVLTGNISEPKFGFSFTIPQDWQGTKSGQGYILISKDEKGFLLVSPHSFKSLDEIEQNASEGINSGSGTILTLVGDLTLTKNNGVAGTFKGILNGQSTVSYVISLLSPFGGGLSIFAFVDVNNYSDDYEDVVKEVSRSVVFAKPELLSSAADQWKLILNNCRLTHLESYNSGNGNGGMQSKIIIDLCEQGYFKYKDESNVSINQGTVDGYSSGTKDSDGEWNVLDKGDHAVLQLIFNNGDVKDYLLSMQNDKTFLNEDRFFRTYKDSTTEGTQPDCF